MTSESIFRKPSKKMDPARSEITRDRIQIALCSRNGTEPFGFLLHLEITWRAELSVSFSMKVKIKKESQNVRQWNKFSSAAPAVTYSTDNFTIPAYYNHMIQLRNYYNVGMATRYWPNDTVIESRCGRDFPHPSRLALGPIQPPI